MTNKAILSQFKVGDIMSNKQILYALYKKGLIGGYSPWGYLESIQIHYKDNWDNRTTIDWRYVDIFPKANRDAIKDVTFESSDALWNAVGNGSSITYMGYEFRTKYLSGCFNPYLQIVAINGDKEMKSNPSISLYGTII